MSNLSLMPLFRRSIGFDRLNDLFDHAMLSEAPLLSHNFSQEEAHLSFLLFYGYFIG